MSLILRFLHRDVRELDAVLRAVSASCRPELERLVADAAAVMDADQLRGYARAWAAALVRAERQRNSDTRGSSAFDEASLQATIVERLVHECVGNLWSPRILPVPAPHVARRAA